MAIIKAGKRGKSLARAIKYAAKDAELAKRPELASGVNCADSAKEAIEAMGDTKNFYQKTGGRQYKSYIQSFAKEEKISAELAQEIGRKWAEKNFGEAGYECFVGTHVASKSGVVHNHIIVNSVNFTNGQKIQRSKVMLEKMKDSNDEICLAHGLSTIDRNKNALDKRGRLQAWTNEKFNALHNKDSWLVDAAHALQTVIHQAPKTPKAFIHAMKKEGWQTNFRGQKHITLISIKNPRQKVRVDTLAKTFLENNWTRVAIEKGFSPIGRQESKKISIQIQQPRSATAPAAISKKQGNQTGGRLAAKLGEEDDAERRYKNSAKSRLDHEIEMDRE